MKNGKVLIAAHVHSVLTEGLLAAGYELIDMQSVSQDEALQIIPECTGVVTSTRLLIDATFLKKATSLKWIGRMGSGMEIIDVKTATEKGIICFSSPEGNRNAVAEHALGMLLSLTKKISSSHAEVKNGLWNREVNRGIELEGKTIAIIGFGNTGRALAKKLSGMEMRILAYDKYHQIEASETIIPCPDLQTIFQEADVVSFHVPMQQDTHHYCNTAFIEQMTKPFLLVNTSRGNVVDTVALQKGLHSGKIMGAALDVLEEEPLEKMTKSLRGVVNSLLLLQQVIITPHIAGYSKESLYKMSALLREKIVTLE